MGWLDMDDLKPAPVGVGQLDFEQLIPLLKAKDKEVRRKAVVSLAKLGDSRAVAPLIEMLNDRARKVQLAALWGLRELKDERVIQPVMAVLQDKTRAYPFARCEAAEALGMLKARSALNLLLMVVEDITEDTAVRRAALEGASYFDEPEVDSLIFKLFLDKSTQIDLRYDAAGLLGELELKGSFEPLVAALQDLTEPGSIRENAAYALGVLHDERALQPLLAALNDEDEDVRYWTANALGHLGNKLAVPDLIETLRHDNSDSVRRAAAYSLGELRDNRAVEPLIEALKNKSWEVRWWVIAALEDIGDVQAIPALTKTLNDRSSQVRNLAARCLAEFGGTEGIPTLPST
jgi:HEAT repeat protein